jgi:hypothetical protein
MVQRSGFIALNLSVPIRLGFDSRWRRLLRERFFYSVSLHLRRCSSFLVSTSLYLFFSRFAFYFTERKTTVAEVCVPIAKPLRTCINGACTPEGEPILPQTWDERKQRRPDVLMTFSRGS